MSTKSPLGPAEILAAWERGYHLTSKRFLAAAWGVDPDAGPEPLAEAVCDRRLIAERLRQIDGSARVALAMVASKGGRMRGENLRRELLLSGQAPASTSLQGLVSRGILIALPNAGESDLDIEGTLPNDGFLQRELAISQAAVELLKEDVASLETTVEEFHGQVEDIIGPGVDVVELNVMHAVGCLLAEPLRLNRLGDPHRRHLVRIARGFVLPGARAEIGEELDLETELHHEFSNLMLAIAASLGMVRATEDKEMLEGVVEPWVEYFSLSRSGRDRRLSTALQGMIHFNEISRVSRQTVPVSLTQAAADEALVGARGYVLSVMKRVRATSWMPLEALLDLCIQFDRGYLASALQDRQLSPRGYAREVLTNFAVHTGLAELATAGDGQQVLRVTERGRTILGIDTEAREEEAQACLIAQPNLEVTVFLDGAQSQVLLSLYRVGRRTSLADRVATFALSSESVQRGFSTGVDADEFLSMMSDRSHAPIPESVEFQIRDWERMHRRMSVIAGGYLLRHQDPDALDNFIGHLSYVSPSTRVVQLGLTSAWVSDLDDQTLEASLRRKQLEVIRQGEAAPGSLTLVDATTLVVDPWRCDIKTWSLLEQITTRPEDPPVAGDVRNLDLDEVEKKWPGDTLVGILEFLDARVSGGVSAERRLQLKHLLGHVTYANIVEDVILLELDDSITADILESVESLQPCIVSRPGPTTLRVTAGFVDKTRAILEELGIDSAPTKRKRGKKS